MWSFTANDETEWILNPGAGSYIPVRSLFSNSINYEDIVVYIYIHLRRMAVNSIPPPILNVTYKTETDYSTTYWER